MRGKGIVERKIDGTKIKIDGRNATILAEVPEEINHSGYYENDELIYTNPSDMMKYDEVIPSLSLIRYAKVKNFIDGIYAAVEERINENGHDLSRPDFLTKLEKVSDGYSKDYINTSLIHHKARREPSWSVPQAFYDWTEELKSAYKQIKILGSEPSFVVENLDERINKKIIHDLHRKIDSSPELKHTYYSLKGIYSKMTGEIKEEDCLFPSSKLPDEEFFMELSDKSQSDIPEGLGKALVKGIKEGKVDFTPNEKSGLYVRQMNEIIPLIKKDSEEYEKYIVNEKYSDMLENEFTSQWAGTRHTHVGHSNFRTALIGCSMSNYTPKIIIRPELEVEPLSTSYERMEKNINFIEKTIENYVPEVMERKRMISREKKSKNKIKEDFKEIKSILKGLSLISKDSIHLEYEEEDVQEPIKNAKRWIKNSEEDPDLKRNVSIFVPIQRTTNGSKQIAYINAGYKPVELEVSYDKMPKVEAEGFGLTEFRSNEYCLPVLVHREVRMPYKKIINDTKLREMIEEISDENTIREKDLDEIVEKLEK